MNTENIIKSSLLVVILSLATTAHGGLNLLDNEGLEVACNDTPTCITLTLVQPVLEEDGNEQRQEVWQEAREANWPSREEVLEKVKCSKELTRSEFIVYLRAVEELNPKMGWQQIVSKLHKRCYPCDSDLVLAGVPLFNNGRDNEGWEDVVLPEGNVPKFVQDGSGSKVDVAHAYAGIRGGLNRSGVSRWAMTNVNTGWGDSLQVTNARLGAITDYLSGALTFNYKKSNKAMDSFSAAPDYKPQNQIEGNNLGIEVQKTLRNNPMSLSEAFDLEMY